MLSKEEKKPAMSYNNDTILSIKNLTVTYNRYGSTVRAIDNLTLDNLKKGSWTFLTGSNGSGKSTLFKTITKEINNYSGAILLNGKDLKQYNPQGIAKTVFLINQNPLSSTVDELTVWENLLFATDKADKEKFENALQQAGLQNHKHHLAKNLSGGQRQLLALQIARLRNVELLLVDEPFAALDPINQEIALQMINKIWKEGTGIVFITHDNKIIDNLEYATSNKVVLNAGKRLI